MKIIHVFYLKKQILMIFYFSKIEFFDFVIFFIFVQIKKHHDLQNRNLQNLVLHQTWLNFDRHALFFHFLRWMAIGSGRSLIWNMTIVTRSF